MIILFPIGYKIDVNIHLSECFKKRNKNNDYMRGKWYAKLSN